MNFNKMKWSRKMHKSKIKMRLIKDSKLQIRKSNKKQRYNSNNLKNKNQIEIYKIKIL